VDQAKMVDARGLSCPEPALMARRALLELGGGTVDVLVDNPASRDNVVRVAEKLGWRASTIDERPEGVYRLVLTK